MRKISFSYNTSVNLAEMDSKPPQIQLFLRDFLIHGDHILVFSMINEELQQLPTIYTPNGKIGVGKTEEKLVENQRLSAVRSA